MNTFFSSIGNALSRLVSFLGKAGVVLLVVFGLMIFAGVPWYIRGAILMVIGILWSRGSLEGQGMRIAQVVAILLLAPLAIHVAGWGLFGKALEERGLGTQFQISNMVDYPDHGVEADLIAYRKTERSRLRTELQTKRQRITSDETAGKITGDEARKQTADAFEWYYERSEELDEIGTQTSSWPSFNKTEKSASSTSGFTCENGRVEELAPNEKRCGFIPAYKLSPDTRPGWKITFPNGKEIPRGTKEIDGDWCLKAGPEGNKFCLS